MYNYTDHWGNIRLSYTLDPQDNVLKILEENHYYPFGLKHKGYSNDQNIIVAQPEGIVIVPVILDRITYNYKYQGQGTAGRAGLNMYDYGARNYDPAIGRWMNIDPLAENFLDKSPYVYAANNPVIYIDLDGMAYDVFGNEEGGGVIGDMKKSASVQRSDDKDKKGGVRIVLNLGGGEDIEDSAATRVKQIQKSYSNDKLIYIDDSNLGNLKEHIESGIASAQKEGYGKTLEFTVYGHNGKDGPIGDYDADNPLDLGNIRNEGLSQGQMSIAGWSNINYNFDTSNSVAAFYGCNSTSWAEKFISMTNVFQSGGIGGRAGGSYTWKGQFDRTIINYGNDVYMRSRDEETNQIYPLVWYTRNISDRDGVLIPTRSYKHIVAKPK